MKKSDTEKSIQYIKSLYYEWRHHMNVSLGFDSTGGKNELRPVPIGHIRKRLEIAISILLTGLWFALLVYTEMPFFTWLACLVGLILGLFAYLYRPHPPTYMKVQFRGDASLHIESLGNFSVSLDDVGPIWLQDGLVYVLVHDYEKRLGDTYEGWILRILRDRAAALGVNEWNQSDIRDRRKELFPKHEMHLKEAREIDRAARSAYGFLLKKRQAADWAKPILLGKPSAIAYDGYDVEIEAGHWIALVNVVLCTTLNGRC